MRLLLRSFTETDLDRMAKLFAENDFMRFSLGVFSREETAGFLEKAGEKRRRIAKDDLRDRFRGFPTIVFSLRAAQLKAA
jgi:RimJ/RimL family protein N-acetyltransferase